MTSKCRPSAVNRGHLHLNCRQGLQIAAMHKNNLSGLKVGFLLHTTNIKSILCCTILRRVLLSYVCLESDADLYHSRAGFILSVAMPGLCCSCCQPFESFCSWFRLQKEEKTAWSCWDQVTDLTTAGCCTCLLWKRYWIVSPVAFQLVSICVCKAIIQSTVQHASESKQTQCPYTLHNDFVLCAIISKYQPLCATGSHTYFIGDSVQIMRNDESCPCAFLAGILHPFHLIWGLRHSKNIVSIFSLLLKRMTDLLHVVNPLQFILRSLLFMANLHSNMSTSWKVRCSRLDALLGVFSS